MVTTELTASDVAVRVRPYLEKINLGDISLSVNEAGIYLTHGYWRIPITPSREPRPLYPYIEALSILNEEFQDNEGINVTITSNDPLDWGFEEDEEDSVVSLSNDTAKNASRKHGRKKMKTSELTPK